MISYGLKIYTSDKSELFNKAVELFATQAFDFIELYHDLNSLDFDKLKLIKMMPVVIHNTNSHGWHEFVLGTEQLVVWEKTKILADFFKSQHIIVHPGRNHNLTSFLENLQKIDDPRILIENMAGLDIHNRPMFAQTLKQLRQIHEHKPICFDFEKAIKAAAYQRLDYEKFVVDCLNYLTPSYFHISGGDKNNPVDEHLNLWESNINWTGIKHCLKQYNATHEVQIVFEVPKTNGLDNDILNLQWFKEL